VGEADPSAVRLRSVSSAAPLKAWLILRFSDRVCLQMHAVASILGGLDLLWLAGWWPGLVRAGLV